MEKPRNLVYLSLAILLIFLVLIAGVYFWVANKSRNQVIFPAGINYLGSQGNLTPMPTVNLSKIGSSGQWMKATGRTFKYSISYPAELQVTAFISDPTDKLAWVTGIVPPQQNVFLNVEKMSDLDPNYTGDSAGFVQNFWRKFSGLSGMKSFEPITNQKGLKGYKAIYVTKTPGIINVNYFFPVPGDADHILQVINGILPEGVFNNVVNSVEFK